MRPKFVAFAILLALAVVTALLLLRPHTSEPIEPELQPAQSKSLRPAPSDSPSAQPRHSVSLKATTVAPDPFANLTLLGTPVPAAAQPYMANAVRSGMVIERERRKFGHDSNGGRLLDGLNQRLFIEDYNYAARATGTLDPKDAESSYTTFASNLTQVVDIQQGEPYPLATAGSAEVRECYTRYLESHDPAFQIIWNQVAVYDPDGHTDLYHGALVYAGFQASLRQHIQEDEIDQLRTIGEVMSMNEGAENLEELVRGSEANLRKYADEIRLVRDATREIFADRMRSRGLDPAILDGLEQVEIDGNVIGPQPIIR